jgi:hypothetical protein
VKHSLILSLATLLLDLYTTPTHSSSASLNQIKLRAMHPLHTSYAIFALLIPVKASYTQSIDNNRRNQTNGTRGIRG